MLPDSSVQSSARVTGMAECVLAEGRPREEGATNRGSSHPLAGFFSMNPLGTHRKDWESPKKVCRMKMRRSWDLRKKKPCEDRVIRCAERTRETRKHLTIPDAKGPSRLGDR